MLWADQTMMLYMDIPEVMNIQVFTERVRFRLGQELLQCCIFLQFC